MIFKPKQKNCLTKLVKIGDKQAKQDALHYAKMLVIVGNNHVLKKLEWQDQVANNHNSIREYLSEKRRKLRMVSIGQVIGDSVYEDDFRRRFGPVEGAIALDLDDRFVGWKLAITQSAAIKPAEVWELLDGVIVFLIGNY